MLISIQNAVGVSISSPPNDGKWLQNDTADNVTLRVGYLRPFVLEFSSQKHTSFNFHPQIHLFSQKTWEFGVSLKYFQKPHTV